MDDEGGEPIYVQAQGLRLDEIFYCGALKNEIRQLGIPKMSDYVIYATLDNLIQPTLVESKKGITVTLTLAMSPLSVENIAQNF